MRALQAPVRRPSARLNPSRLKIDGASSRATTVGYAQTARQSQTPGCRNRRARRQHSKQPG